ncbi:MAG: SDR family NAD(P)-dependent oxidoreductase [Verrucomicrobia bacterium]|nr:SDR family NAD(P)-dependent oxidoreductase [Verrucomicrobiota bacterium]
MDNPLDLRGRRVLVTGAASGIGLATCQLLSRLGGRIVAVDANVEGITRALASFEGTEHDSRFFDLREVERIPRWLVEVAAAGGPLFGVVHAAGLSCIQPARLLEPNRYRDVMLVNTEAALALARGFQNKKVSEPSGGSIIFVSSVMALVGSPGAAAYGMTKAALMGLTKSLAVEFAPRKVRVNCVAPGFVKTPMFDRLSSMWDGEQRTHVESEHPLGLGEPVDVANAIAFLLADTGRWITGSVLVLDGGYSAH